ncbi:MAG: 2Fe-2S iron-sulfur cluster-binding protein [Sphingopyxis sp.]
MARTTDNPAPSHPPAGGSANGANICAIRLKSGEAFSVRRGDLLLPAALAQGVNYPHSCRVGTCGRCKTRLIAGRISPQVDFALSPLSNADLQDGYILACQAKVRGDLTIDVGLIAQDVVLPRMVRGVISHWARLPGDVIDLRVVLDEPMRFDAGQYATLAISGSFVRRSFSFYDAPHATAPTREVGFFIRILPDGRFSQWLAAADRRGIPLWVEGPFGQMGLADEPRDALCVAGGTGIAPILSIAADRLRRFPQHRVTVVFGVRRSADLFAMDRLRALEQGSGGRLTVRPILSHEPDGTGWRGDHGLVTDGVRPADAPPGHPISAFVCGSLPMVLAVEERLRALGVPAECIHADKFEPSGP